MGTRKKTDEAAPDEVSKPVRATKPKPPAKPASGKKPATSAPPTKKPPAKKPSAPAPAAAEKKPATKRAPAKKKTPASAAEKEPKSRVHVRKNRSAAEKAQGNVAMAETVPPQPDLAESLGLSMKEALFVDRYLVSYNGRQAYAEAGYKSASENAASVASSKLLRRPNVAEYLRLRGKEMISRTEDEQDRLIQTIRYVAYGDMNDLIMNRVDCCRFCYGERNLYHFTPQEFERYKEDYEAECVVLKAAGATPAPLDPKGGIGFNPNHEPNPDCPECFGRGEPKVIMADTRFLGPAAQAMYAGVKVGKNGIEIVANSQDKAREHLAKITKLFEDNTTVNLNFDAETLDKTFGEAMEKSTARMQQMLEDRRKAREERGHD